MHKQILIWLSLAAGLLAFARSQPDTVVYMPFVYWADTTRITCQGQITGTVFEDSDLDGRRDGGESGIPDICLELRLYNGPVVARVVTDPNGRYGINVSPGKYELEAEKPRDFQWTTPDSWGIDIVCAAIQVNFGLARLCHIDEHGRLTCDPPASLGTSNGKAAPHQSGSCAAVAGR
jgi:hypothetical protein